MKKDILIKLTSTPSKLIGFVLLVAAMVVVQSCKKKLPFSYQVQDRKLLMFDQIKTDTNFSIFVEALEKTQLSSVINSYGPYTVFAPDNSGFRKYFALKGKKSLADFALDSLSNIIRYHIILARQGDGALSAANFIQGPQTTASANGDLINIDISKGYKNNAVANAVALIYNTDNEYSNGLLHKMDGVLDPPILTIGEFLLANPSTFSIITSGLQKAGLMDTLTKLNNPFGVRTRLTLFAETNDVLRANGINDYNGYSTDSLVRYMRNHLVAGSASSKGYTRNNTAIAALNVIDRYDSTVGTLDGEDWLYFNLAATNLIDVTTNFTVSDLSMRNGIIHNVSKPLVFTGPTKKRTQILHYFYLNEAYGYGVTGTANGAAPIANLSSGGTTFRWYPDGPGNHLFFPGDSPGDSCVVVVKGIKRGKYQFVVSGKGGGRGTYQIWNGADSLFTYNFSFVGLPTYRQNYILGTYDFKSSGNKRIRFVNTNVGNGQLNVECFVLNPVE
ncbi:MAG: fasciclin domain-containing protein [Bacteroidota bacterium]